MNRSNIPATEFKRGVQPPLIEEYFTDQYLLSMLSVILCNYAPTNDMHNKDDAMLDLNDFKCAYH